MNINKLVEIVTITDGFVMGPIEYATNLTITEFSSCLFVRSTISLIFTFYIGFEAFGLEYVMLKLPRIVWQYRLTY